MFGFIKKSEVARLENELADIKKQAAHMHGLSEQVKGQAFNDLYWLAIQEGITAKEAARTDRGFEILSQVALNRQYALYLNESAIQTYAELNRLKQSPQPTHTNEAWLKNIVCHAGAEILNDEVERLMPTLVREVDQRLSEDAED